MASVSDLHGTPLPGRPHAPGHPVPEPKPVRAKPVTPPRAPSRAVRREAVAAAQAAAAPSSPVPKTFQPWASVIQHAEQRMRGRLALALADLERDMSTAGAVLDTAEQAAREAESQILAAAWARWHQDLDAAADASLAVMEPARHAYAQLVDRAGRDFDQAIADARAAYEAELSRAQSAHALAASMPDPASATAPA